MIIKWLDGSTVMIDDSTFKVMWRFPISDYAAKSFMPIIMITGCSHQHNRNFVIITEIGTRDMVGCHVDANHIINQYLVDLWN